MIGGFQFTLVFFDVGGTAYRSDNVNKALYGADTQHAKGQKTNDSRSTYIK